MTTRDSSAVDVEDDEPAANEAMRAREPFPVVGVGGGAGSVGAFTEVLDGLPPDLGIALVFVTTHAELGEDVVRTLASHTQMPVEALAAATRIAPDHVYVAPSDRVWRVLDGVLTPSARGEQRAPPIDALLTALATDCQRCAIGVILSGAGVDGVLGLREVKSVGGITLVQDPDTALDGGISRSAIAAGSVDLVLAPGRIAEELRHISRHPYVLPGHPGDELVVHHEQLHRIFEQLRDVSGVDFTHYKPSTIRRRLQRRIVLNKYDRVEPYIQFLRVNPDEVARLYKDLLIHVTRFFRDPESFAALANHVFPALLQGRRGGQPLRIWLPGCSTGEEAYTVAIALLESVGDEAGGVPIQIFASDVSESAIEQARSGTYPETIAADLTPERLRRFFTHADGRYRISRAVRDLCVFARQDITRDPPFSKLDLIVCRNVLIYLGSVLQHKLMTVFHYALKPNGYLMLGGAETVGTQVDLFTVVDKKHRIFLKKRIDASTHVSIPVSYTPGVAVGRPRLTRETFAGPTFQTEANRLVLECYGPPGVVVDENFQVVQFRGKTGDYLEPAPGDASQGQNLLKMAREGLLYGLQTALHDARKSDAPVRKPGLRVAFNGRGRNVDLQVIPFTLDVSRHYLVLFEGGPEGGEAEPRRLEQVGASDDLLIQQLRDELTASREYLQSIIQDLEATNEELQSANEEILSSNEELQSTNEELDTAKEELQSTNEELNTVNDELHARNDELSRVNSDLVNLLGCVEIAIVIVGADLCIRRFTPMAEKVLNLIPADIGRPIGQIKPNIEYPGLAKRLAHVIDTVTTHEMNVRDGEGHWYSLRIRPYKDVENRIDGAVLALFDIASPRPEHELRTARDNTRAIIDTIIDTMPVPVVVLDRHLRIQSLNAPFAARFDLAPDLALHCCIYDLHSGQWGGPRLRVLLDEVLPREGRVAGFRIDGVFPGPASVTSDACRIDGGDHGPAFIVLTLRDTVPGAHDG